MLSLLRISLAGALLATLWLRRITWTWTICQLMRSSWPPFIPMPPSISSSLTHVEGWAWAQWEQEMSITRRPPLPIPEYFSPPTADMDLRRPFLVRGFLNGTSTLLTWTPEFFASAPYGDLLMDFFTDARIFNTVPNSVAPLKEIIQNISGGGPQKFASEMVFRKFPELLEDLNVTWLAAAFGHHFKKEYIGTTLTMPLFYAQGQHVTTTRTDLHCEPIGNVVLMLSGSKKWTLVPPSQSQYLRPQASPDGRAYIFSRRVPTALELQGLERYELIANAGDLLWVPTWTWHRVDYTPGVASLSLGMFHFRAYDFAVNNPLFAFALLPNLMKELWGLKAQ